MALITFRKQDGFEALKHLERVGVPARMLWDEPSVGGFCPLEVQDHALAIVQRELERHGLWKVATPVDLAIVAAERRILQSVGYLQWDFEPERFHRTRNGKAERGQRFVGPGSLFASPFEAGVDGDAQECVSLYRRWLGRDEVVVARVGREPPTRADILSLATYDLACTCADGQPCHADMLLLLANSVAAYRELFLFVDGPTQVYRVLHERERSQLIYWYCLEPRDIGRLLGTSQFDVRNLPAEFFQGDCRSSEHHADAIIAALDAGYDIQAGERACRAEKEALCAEADALRRRQSFRIVGTEDAVADLDEIPF